MKRTPGISTTDLVGRMLLCTKTHFIKSFASLLSGEEGPGNTEERKQAAQEMKQRIKDYASDESGLMPGAVVLSWNARSGTVPIHKRDGEFGAFSLTVDGTCPRPGQRIVYVDGGFDLFSSGHIEFLRQVLIREEALGDINGWFNNETAEQRIRKVGEDYGPAYIVAGIHDDTVINHWKGVNYPIMNIFERGLCVLQCRVSRYPPPFHLLDRLSLIDPTKSSSMPSFSRPPSSRTEHTLLKCPGVSRMPYTTAPPPLSPSRLTRTLTPRT